MKQQTTEDFFPHKETGKTKAFYRHTESGQIVVIERREDGAIVGSCLVTEPPRDIDSYQCKPDNNVWLAEQGDKLRLLSDEVDLRGKCRLRLEPIESQREQAEKEKRRIHKETRELLQDWPHGIVKALDQWIEQEHPKAEQDHAFENYKRYIETPELGRLLIFWNPTHLTDTAIKKVCRFLLNMHKAGTADAIEKQVTAMLVCFGRRESTAPPAPGDEPLITGLVKLDRAMVTKALMRLRELVQEGIDQPFQGGLRPQNCQRQHILFLACGAGSANCIRKPRVHCMKNGNVILERSGRTGGHRVWKIQLAGAMVRKKDTKSYCLST